ncbi:MAG: hypothetical protein MAG795_00854 [Candidatus Woesearchaeota archaeon]|nr:hypothetical protein [Candidatus Woesearchaeota archaeon]
MKVAVLYSGGKDSTYAVDYALERGWDVEYLLSIKPSRKDCYLFHYATVEHTDKQAKLLGLKHILRKCDVADPKKEAAIVKKAVLENPVDAVILGGTGLQVTQIRAVQEALRPEGIEVFASHAGLDHDKMVEEMLDKGYVFMVTQVASDGLMSWLGRKISLANYDDLKRDSMKYGFHVGFEGGYADTFVVSGPIFKKEIEVMESKKIVEDEYCGHIEFKKLKFKTKQEKKHSVDTKI